MLGNIRLQLFRVTLLLPLVTLLLIQPQTTAQHEDIPANTVVIVNPHTATINFWLKNSETDWEWDELAPDASKSYRYRNQLKLISDKNDVTVRHLAYKTRYRFAWNQQTKLWDIEMVP